MLYEFTKLIKSIKALYIVLRKLFCLNIIFINFTGDIILIFSKFKKFLSINILDKIFKLNL